MTSLNVVCLLFYRTLLVHGCHATAAGGVGTYLLLIKYLLQKYSNNFFHQHRMKRIACRSAKKKTKKIVFEIIVTEIRDSLCKYVGIISGEKLWFLSEENSKKKKNLTVVVKSIFIYLDR